MRDTFLRKAQPTCSLKFVRRIKGGHQINSRQWRPSCSMGLLNAPALVTFPLKLGRSWTFSRGPLAIVLSWMAFASGDNRVKRVVSSSSTEGRRGCGVAVRVRVRAVLGTEREGTHLEGCPKVFLPYSVVLSLKGRFALSQSWAQTSAGL